MPRIHYLSGQSQVLAMINKHFPPAIYNRFEVKMDVDIFKPSEDEGVFLRKKSNTQHMHILFDGLELLEIPPTVPRDYVELFILRAFRDAIDEGRIYFDKVLEWTDNDTAKRNQKEKAEKKKKQVEEAYKFARDNRFNVKQIEAKLPRAGKSKKGQTVRKFELKGGE